MLCPSVPTIVVCCARTSTAREATDWHRDRSALRRGSSRHASRRASCAALPRIEAVWICKTLLNLWVAPKPYQCPPYFGSMPLIASGARKSPLITEATVQSYPHKFEQAITTSGQPQILNSERAECVGLGQGVEGRLHTNLPKPDRPEIGTTCRRSNYVGDVDFAHF